MSTTTQTTRDAAPAADLGTPIFDQLTTEHRMIELQSCPHLAVDLELQLKAGGN